MKRRRAPVERDVRMIRFALAIILILIGLYLGGVFTTHTETHTTFRGTFRMSE
jgi:hypothetical protein